MTRSQPEVLALNREEQVRVVSESFAALAAAVEAREQAQVTAALTAARELCAWIAPHQAEAVRSLLNDLLQRLQVWQEVWPRLGNDAGFRTAIIRESRLWSAKLRTEHQKK